jgi:NhaP-type Na+/H+ or K+/H+ antiporter
MSRVLCMQVYQQGITNDKRKLENQGFVVCIFHLILLVVSVSSGSATTCMYVCIRDGPEIRPLHRDLQ